MACFSSLHQPVLDLALSSVTLAPVTVVARSHFCSSPYLCRPHQARPAPRPVAAREYPHREALWKILCSSEPGPSMTRAHDSCVPSQRGSDVFLTSPSLHCDFLRHPFFPRRPYRESVLRTSLAHLAVGVSRARHRLSVTFEMLGLCCCPDVMSSFVLDLVLRTRHSSCASRDVITAASCS